MSKVMRHMIADYLQTAASPSVVNSLMGTGFTTLDENPAAKVDSTAFVNDRSASGSISGYACVFPFDTQLITDQAAVAFLHNIARNQKTGDEAETYYYRVDLYGGAAGSTEYPARKFKVAVEVSGVTAAGGEIVKVAGNLHQIGDLVEGTFDTSDNSFTPAA